MVIGSVRKNLIKEYITKRDFRIGQESLHEFVERIDTMITNEMNKMIDSISVLNEEVMERRLTTNNLEGMKEKYSKKKHPEDMDEITWRYKRNEVRSSWVYKSSLNDFFEYRRIKVNKNVLDEIVDIVDIIIKRKTNLLFKILPRKSTGALYRKTIKLEDINFVFRELSERKVV